MHAVFPEFSQATECALVLQHSRGQQYLTSSHVQKELLRAETSLKLLRDTVPTLPSETETITKNQLRFKFLQAVRRRNGNEADYRFASNLFEKISQSTKYLDLVCLLRKVHAALKGYLNSIEGKIIEFSPILHKKILSCIQKKKRQTKYNRSSDIDAKIIDDVLQYAIQMANTDFKVVFVTLEEDLIDCTHDILEITEKHHSSVSYYDLCGNRCFDIQTPAKVLQEETA